MIKELEKKLRLLRSPGVSRMLLDTVVIYNILNEGDETTDEQYANITETVIRHLRSGYQKELNEQKRLKTVDKLKIHQITLEESIAQIKQQEEFRKANMNNYKCDEV